MNPEFVIDFSSVRGNFEKAINRALYSAIDAHGPITRENVSSASKRVIGAIKSWNRNHRIEIAQIRTCNRSRALIRLNPEVRTAKLIIEFDDGTVSEAVFDIETERFVFAEGVI